MTLLLSLRNMFGKKKCKVGRGSWSLRLARRFSLKLWLNPFLHIQWGFFQLPGKLCDELDAMCDRFWRGQLGEERKIHWKNWSFLTLSKKEGEMGFRDTII